MTQVEIARKLAKTKCPSVLLEIAKESKFYDKMPKRPQRKEGEDKSHLVIRKRGYEKRMGNWLKKLVSTKGYNYEFEK